MMEKFEIGDYIDTAQFGIVKVVSLSYYSEDLEYPVIGYDKEPYAYMYDNDIMIKANKHDWWDDYINEKS